MKALNPPLHDETSQTGVATELLPLEIDSVSGPQCRTITGTFMDRVLAVRAVATGQIRTAPRPRSR